MELPYPAIRYEMKSIGKYEIRGLLGKGGMSRVYKVVLPVIGKVAALKVLDPHPTLLSLIGRKTLQDIFTAEARKLASVRHPNVAGIWDFGEAEGTLHYLMEYCAGNLGTTIGETYRVEDPSRILPVDRASDYARQALEGLACLHHAGLIHRDIKPYNLLLTDDDTVRICDFGLSALRGERSWGPPQLKVGSPFYAAPEQEADPDGARETADIYAVGVILYRMLTGRLPQPIGRSFLPASRHNADLDEEWDGFLARTLDPDPGRRFATAVDTLEALEGVVGRWEKKRSRWCDLPEPPAVPRPAADMRPRRRDCVKVPARKAREAFGLDALFRPRPYAAADRLVAEGACVRDGSTGLVWQQSGSPYPMTWDQARDHIRGLRQSRFGGRDDWRLPTVDELISVLVPPAQGRSWCIPPVFDRTQRALWSCDRRSFTSAWFVGIDLGFAAWQDFTAGCHVRAVR